MGGHTARYDKNGNHQQCVRRPESGTWQSVAIETAAMGGRTGTHDTLCGPGSSMRGGGTGAHGRLRAWQQHEESVRGPMTHSGPWQQHEEAVQGR
ncbi:unnamed protein product, partial [Staurois parvus]